MCSVELARGHGRLLAFTSDGRMVVVSPLLFVRGGFPWLVLRLHVVADKSHSEEAGLSHDNHRRRRVQGYIRCAHGLFQHAAGGTRQAADPDYPAARRPRSTDGALPADAILARRTFNGHRHRWYHAGNNLSVPYSLAVQAGEGSGD